MTTSCVHCNGTFEPSDPDQAARHTEPSTDRNCCKKCWRKPKCAWCDYQYCTCRTH